MLRYLSGITDTVSEKDKSQLEKIITVKIIYVPLLNMTSTAPLSIVLILLSQRKEGKRGRSVSHV